MARRVNLDKVTGPWPYAKDDEQLMRASVQRGLRVRWWILLGVVTLAGLTVVDLVLAFVLSAPQWSLRAFGALFLAWFVMLLAWCLTLDSKDPDGLNVFDEVEF